MPMKVRGFSHIEHSQSLSNTDSPAVSDVKPTPARRDFADVWRRYQENSQIIFEPDIPSALESARKIGVGAGGAHVLVTGSLHIVGGALFYLQERISGDS